MEKSSIYEFGDVRSILDSSSFILQELLHMLGIEEHPRTRVSLQGPSKLR